MTTTSKPNPRRRLMARFGVKPRKPDWQVWQVIQNVPVWKAVALSCDIEPNDLEGWRESPPAYIPPEIFRHRLEQAIAALSLNGGPLVSKPRGHDSALHRVELGDFRAWAVSAGLSLPDQFPVFEVSHPPYESPKDKQLRLTVEIAYEKSIGTPNHTEAVAARVVNGKFGGIGISPQRLRIIVGTKQAQADRLAAFRQSNPEGYARAMERIAATRARGMPTK